MAEYYVTSDQLPKYHCLYSTLKKELKLEDVVHRYKASDGSDLAPIYTLPDYSPELTFSDKHITFMSGMNWVDSFGGNFKFAFDLGSSYYAPASALFVLSGTFPKFKKKLLEITTPDSYEISRSSSELRIKRSDGSLYHVFSKNDFEDNVIPSSLIAVIVGAGGGGSGSDGVFNQTDGSGGGGGGIIIGVLKFTDSRSIYSATVGYGGAGGGKSSNGNNGSMSYISLSRAPYGLYAYGGAGGNVSNNTGGAGGSYEVKNIDSESLFYKLAGAQGSSGGSKHSSGAARNAFTAKIYQLTTDWTELSNNKLTIASANGGSSDNSSGGGGGASFGNGGSGGSGNGYAGSKGSGGGGAGGGTGGKGGDGYIALYY